MLWLDHPRWLVMRQVIVHTVARRLRRQVLWNGNVEPPLHTFFTDHEHVIRWAWHTRGKPGLLVHELLAARADQVAVVRLHGRRQVDSWVHHHAVTG